MARNRWPVYLEDWMKFAEGFGTGWWLGPPRRNTRAQKAQQRAEREWQERQRTEMRKLWQECQDETGKGTERAHGSEQGIFRVSADGTATRA